MTTIKLPISLLAVLTISSVAHIAVAAEDLKLADKPLAVETSGVNPNIMLLTDNSGSMSNNSSFDVFYAPGFDANREYRCINNKQVLKADNSKIVEVHISTKSGESGLPFFKYGSNYYTWGSNNKSTISNNIAITKAVCFDPDEKYRVKLKANSSGSQHYKPASGATIDTYAGNFLNWYFSATKAEWASYTTIDGSYTNYSGSNGHGYWTENHATNFSTKETTSAGKYIEQRGFKYMVHDKHQRIMVANDVAMKLVRDLDKANVAFSTYNSYINAQGNYVASTHASAPFLIHHFVEIDSSKPNYEANKLSLIDVMGRLSTASNTPTAKSLTGAARYFFTGWLDENKKNINVNGSMKSIAEVLPTSFNSASRPKGQIQDKYIREETWCQKHAIAVLTDGLPVSDSIQASLKSYRPVGAMGGAGPGGNSTTDAKNFMWRVAGALTDLDFLPHLGGKPEGMKTNVEPYFIGMGATTIINSDTFIKTGIAAGGDGVRSNYYKGNDGAAIAEAFKDIIERIQAQAASVTAIAVSSVADVREDNYAIQAVYETTHWSSKLRAYKFNKDGLFVNPNDPDGPGYESASQVTPAWEANNLLNQTYITGSRSVSQRNVYTWNDDTSNGIRFGGDSLSLTGISNFMNSLPESWQKDIRTRAGSDSAAQYDLIMYLLGDITHEDGVTGTGKFRKRGEYELNSQNKVVKVSEGGFLGDIVHSSPLYVKAPPRPWDDRNFGTANNRYSHFKDNLKDRTAVVYVGTNRGYLHAFAVDGSNAGKELFAYMPTALTSSELSKGYHHLASKSYDHQFYVDLTPTVSDVFVDFYNNGVTSSYNPEWRTILVGGLRAGGKGYFALDITCPEPIANSSVCANNNSGFKANNVLWEFTSADDSDMGYSFGEPVIAKVNFNYNNTGASNRNGNGKGRWAAIIPNGYNSKDGKAVLYIVFVDGPSGRNAAGKKVWKKGRDYLKIVVDSSSPNGFKNGLSSATAIDVDGDGIVDHIYAGDLNGKMWSFNVSQTIISSGN